MMEDLKNSYLNEQGLRQERDALLDAGVRLSDDIWRLGGTIASYAAALELARREDIRLVAENERLREMLLETSAFLSGRLLTSGSGLRARIRDVLFPNDQKLGNRT